MPEADALQATRDYFQGDELAATTWLRKYALRDGEGELVERTPADMHRRMAKEFARVEASHAPVPAKKKALLSPYGQQRGPLDEARIFDLFDGFRQVVPQGSVMAALGDPFRLASLSNCVVLPPPFDSYGGILYTDQQLAQLCKRRCGVGFDLSTLRPLGTPVRNAARSSTGAVSFMDRYSHTVREVAQLGRRGALMLTLDIAHPDVAAFIASKQDLTKVTGANISVRITDAFMEAVEKDGPFTLHWPLDAEDPVVRREVRARELWDLLVRCAHHTAEPGLLFWDRHHRYSTSSVYPGFRNAGTNPCSEIAMQGGDSCRLMALDLMGFVSDPFTASARFDHTRFAEVTYEAMRLMDDLVDLELEGIDRILEKIAADPEPEVVKQVERETWILLRDMGRKGRRTGLGFTGLADALAALGLKYDSDAACGTTEAILRTKCRAEFDCSIDLAIERGAFDGFDPAVEATSEFVQMLQEEFPDVHERMMEHGRRHISLSTVAPTGSISLLTRTSSGIEPVYRLEYVRRRKISEQTANDDATFVDALGDRWEEFTVKHPGLEQWMSVAGEQDPAKSPYAGATAAEIAWEHRIRLQAIVQKYTTHAISSTINLTEDTTVERIGAILLEAWRSGVKGITIYRDGSRSGVLVEAKHATDVRPPEHRPDVLEADILRFMNGDQPWLAVVGLWNGRPYEIFTGRAEEAFDLPLEVTQGKVVKHFPQIGPAKRYDLVYTEVNGRKVTAEGLSRAFDREFWNYAILISGLLRQGIPVAEVVELTTRLHLKDRSLNNWKNGVVRALRRYIPEGTAAIGEACPECGATDQLYYEEGCMKCMHCGAAMCQ